VVRGQVRGTGLEPFFLDVVVATIPGADTTAGELVFSAHLDHPKESANDNASGSGAILDIARALRELIDGGRLPRPRRTLRFLWVPEWYGTMAWIDAHPEVAGPGLGGRMLAMLNLDMVGEHLEFLHSTLVLTRTPASLPSAVNDVVANMAEMVDRLDVRTPRGSLSRMNWRMTPYSGGSDHMMFIDRGIPGVMFTHDPDYTHHTSEDTPDKVDPVELERSEIVATAAMLYLSDLSAVEAVDLVHLTAANGAARLGGALRQARQRMLAAGAARQDAFAEARNALVHAGRQERDAVRSVLTFAGGAGAATVRDAGASAERRLGGHEAALIDDLRSAARAAGLPTGERPRAADVRVPMRLTRGPSTSACRRAGWGPSAPRGIAATCRSVMMRGSSW
jgi:hypothetical protein